MPNAVIIPRIHSRRLQEERSPFHSVRIIVVPNILLLAVPEFDEDFTEPLLTSADGHQFRHDPFHGVHVGDASMVVVAATHGNAILYNATVDLKVIVHRGSPIFGVVESLEVVTVHDVVVVT